VVEGGTVTIKQGHGWHVLGGWDNVQNQWDLALGTAKPFELAIQKGVSENLFTLGGIPLTELSVESGTGATTVTFDKRNPSVGNHVSFKAGAGSLKVSDLLNANARLISVDSGAGEVSLDFTGEGLQQDAGVKINIGAGKLVINVKQGIPVGMIV